ncbi:MAG: peptidoglycan DD-metalloendopeptidase family protein [Chloroflexi bacterium]|nr:peptidoglycan DD-metalloendopeptidase family protein [Chloroflexota bacterium]MBU1750133.1 peptidoglycan DD-metalloendopeptidase family protein [Chloroflexota bacterium]
MDFANGSNFEVLAMADGVVENVSCGNPGFGCQVAIRHDVGGTVLIYAHLLENSVTVGETNPPTHVDQGTILGKAGKSGGQTSPHLHIELRDGGDDCYFQCLPDSLGGNPIGWDDLIPLVDGYHIGGYLVDSEGLTAYNYDGSAVKGDVNVIYDFPFLDWPTNQSKSAIARVHSSYQCNPSANTCEDNCQSLLTQFAGHGSFDGGSCDSSQNAIATANSLNGQLISSNIPQMPVLPASPCSDNAAFVSDITLPDGSVVSPGQSLVKTWRLRNNGTSTWGTGYQLTFIGGDQIGAPGSVSLPQSVARGETVDISVNMTAPSSGGNYQGNWRMRNAQGVYFGDQIWVKINVIGTTSGDHIAAFAADPLSPSSASTVRLYARVNWWSQFRAMRIRVDNQVVGETAAAEHTFDWNTSEVSRGDHAVVLEVADQTDTSWSHPERRVLIYTLSGSPAPANHAPNRPNPTSPYDWYVYYSGNTAQLAAQANGDPDGDAITGYYFDIYDSAESWNSGWVGSNSVTTAALGPHDYQWRVKVRDSQGAESEWSDSWHFTLVNPSLSISELYFQPQDGNSEQVKIRACTTGQGGIGITMRVSVNDANDGSGNGTWHIIKELGVPCFNDVDAPIWNTLEYGDGPHRVRVEAHGLNTGWDGAAVREETYTLPHRRPASPRLVAPVPASGDLREAIYLNSRTITFRWEPAIRANSYTLHVGTNPAPQDDPSPIFRQTFASDVTEHVVTFDGDYPTLYWQVTATNDAGTSGSGDQLFGIDRTTPSCAVQPLPATTPETVFQVSWGGSDNLAGIRTFDIQYRDSNRDTWSDWLTGVPAAKTYELFTGQPGHTYYFRGRATDNAGNTGDYPADADAFTKVDPAARPPAPWWDGEYSSKRNLTILNNMPGVAVPAGYPVHLHFDGGTTPTAAELYAASQSSPKGNDCRIIYNDTTELDRVVQSFSSSTIDIWFRTQVSIPGGSSNNSAHQLYYGNAGAGTPPGSPNTVFDPPSDANTVGLWYMHGGSGSILNDSSGYGNHGTIDSSATWVTPAKFSGALRFPGGTDGATVNCGSSSLFNLQTFTYEMFLRRTGAAWGRLAGHLGGGQNRWLMTFSDNGKIRISIWPCPTCGAEEFNSNTAIGDTTNWHHVAFSLQSSTVKIYIDGQLDSTGTVVWGNIRSGTPPLTIGSAENIQRAFAELTHVRLSNIARTSFPYGAFAAITNEPTTAAGAAVEPPVTGSPDLAVISLDTYSNPDGGVLVQTTVRNQGNLPTQNGFFTDVYADHLPTGAGDYTGSLHFWVANPIEANQTVTLTTVITGSTGLRQAGALDIGATSEVTSTLYVQVDSTGAVSENDKLNNIYTGTEVCLANADAYEPDSTPAAAQPIALDQTQQHNCHGLGDQDWLAFAAQSGVTYTIWTSNLGPAADTYLYVYDTDGTTLLASNDDYGGSLASQIEWTAPAAGTYYVLVQHWNPNAAGCGTGYDLTIQRHLFGDLDHDCDVDVADIMQVASRWNTHTGDPGYDPAYDLDHDGDIDVADIMLVAAAWGQTCD